MLAATLCLCIKADAQPSILLGFKKTGFGAGKLTGLGGKLEPGEKPSAAILREVREASGLILAASDLQRVARLLFFFPGRPAWDHAVDLFTARSWLEKPIETTEIKPLWFSIDRLPFDRMWPDARYWLPPVLARQKLHAQFIYRTDCASLSSYSLSPWEAEITESPKKTISRAVYLIRSRMP